MSMLLSRTDPDRATEEERELEREIHALLKARYPDARVEVGIRICCPALADTYMPCSKAHAHEGKHYVESKDREFTYDHNDMKPALTSKEQKRLARKAPTKKD